MILRRLRLAIVVLRDFLGSSIQPMISLGIICLLIYVVWQWRTRHVVFDPFIIAVSQKDANLNAEVITKQFIDRLSSFISPTDLAWRYPALAPSWESGEIVLPGLNISAAAVIEVLKSAFGPVDRRVMGEVVTVPGSCCPFELRLRVTDSQGSWTALEPPQAFNRYPHDTDPATLFDPALYALLLETEPLTLASRDYVYYVERYSERLPKEKSPFNFCELHRRGAIVDAIDRCLDGVCTSASDKARAHLLWGDLLVWASDRRGSDRSLLYQALGEFEESTKITNEFPYAYTPWAAALLKLDRRKEAWVKFSEAARLFPLHYAPHYDWAEAITTLLEDGHHLDNPARVGLESALEHYSKSWRADPRQDWPLVRWGQTLFQLQRWHDAEKKFRGAIRINPNNVEIRWELCKALLRRKEEAERSCGKVNKLMTTMSDSTEFGARCGKAHLSERLDELKLQVEQECDRADVVDIMSRRNQLKNHGPDCAVQDRR